MSRLLAAFILNLFLAFPAMAGEIITIVADNWCPYNCTPNSERPGFMIEIAKKAFAKHGIEINYSILPWERAIAETRNGKYAAIVGASMSDAPDFIFPKIPQGWMQNRFYVKKGFDWRYTDERSLNKISLGVISGYSYNDNIDDYIKKYAYDPKRIQTLSGDNALESNVNKLLAGRVHAIIEDAHVMYYYMGEHKIRDQLDEVGVVEASRQNDLYIAFSPKNPNAKRYAEILSTEMKDLRKTGELQKILATYMVPDWKK